MTPSGMMFKQRDIILIPIPFTDLASQKKRPAIVISSDKYNDTSEDIIVVALTSNVKKQDFTIVITSEDLEDGKLKATSMIRVDKIYTLNKSIVLKQFGRIKSSVLAKIKTTLLKLIEQENASASY
jgi:mRNA interferase MazF